MNRELKFRAWDGDRMLFHVSIWNRPPVNKWIDRKGVKHRSLKPVEVMQFTGLQDSEGVDIYEGDILRFSHQGDYYSTGPVGWREEVCGYGVIDLTTVEPEDLCVQADFPDTYTVIGNIHQNGDLLK